TSGLSAGIRASACAAVAASPTTVSSASDSSMSATPRRTTSWSSTRNTRIMRHPPAGPWRTREREGSGSTRAEPSHSTSAEIDHRGAGRRRVQGLDVCRVFLRDRLALQLHGRRDFVPAGLPELRHDREPLDLLDPGQLL